MSLKLHKKEELDSFLKETQKRLNSYKSSFLNNLKIGQFIDIKTEKKDQKIAKILKKTKYSIQVLIDGYSKDFKEQIQKSSYYINPFKTKTGIYTGPLKNSVRYYDMENIEELISFWTIKLNQFDFQKKDFFGKKKKEFKNGKHSENGNGLGNGNDFKNENDKDFKNDNYIENDLKNENDIENDLKNENYKDNDLKNENYIENDLKNGDYFENGDYFSDNEDDFDVLQELRGELFIFIDFLLCLNDPLPSTYYLKILELFKSFVLFMNHYFNFLYDFAFLGYFFEIEPDCFLVDFKLALISCLPEFLYILKSLLGESKKKIKLFDNLESNFWSQQEDLMEFKNHKEFFFDFIKSSNIFDCIFKITCFSFKIENKDKIEILKINTGLLIPIYDFLITIILTATKIEERRLFLYKTEKSINEYLLNFTKSDAELTDIDKIYNLYKIRNKINILTKKYEIETNFNEITFEELKIKILFFYLNSENFKKTLKTSKYLNAYLTLKTQKKLKKHITNKFLQNNIIKILYGNNSKNDLIKTTHEFVEFIAPFINFELLCQMFEFKKKANKAKIVEIDHALKVFMRYMESSILNETVRKIYSDLENINVFVLSFLIESVVMNKDSKGNFFSNFFWDFKDGGLEAIRLETLSLLYKLLADPEIVIGKNILKFCLDGFKRILDEFSPKIVVQKYFDMGFRKFNGDDFNLEIVELLFYVSEKIVIKKGFLGIGKSSNLDDGYLKKFNICKIMQNFLEKNFKRMDNKENQIFLEFFFKFYSNIIEKLNLNLERQFFNKTWLFCFNSESQFLRNLFVDFVKKNYENTLNVFQIFPSYFNDAFIKIDNKNKEYYNLFFYLFIVENEKAGIIETLTKKIEDQVFETNNKLEYLEGFEKLWEFLLFTEKESLIKIIINFIILIYRSFNSKITIEKSKTIINNFLNRSKIYLHMSFTKRNFSAAKNYLKLSTKYIESFNKKKKSNRNSFEKVEIIFKYENIKKNIQVEANLNFSGLLEELIKQFNLKGFFNLKINKQLINSYILLEKYDMLNIPKNEYGERVVEIEEVEKNLDLDVLKNFILQILKFDEEIFSICECLLDEKNDFFKNDLLAFMKKFQPQRNYLRYFKIKFSVLPSLKIEKILFLDNSFKFQLFLDLLNVLLKNEIRNKNHNIIKIIRKQHLPNLISFLAKILKDEKKEENIINCLNITISILEEKNNLTMFIINFNKINDLILQNTFFLTENIFQKFENKFKYQILLDLWVNMYRSNCLKFSSFVENLLNFLNIKQKNILYENFKIFIEQFDKIEFDNNEINKLISLYNKKKEDENYLVNIVFLKIFSKFQKEKKNDKNLENVLKITIREFFTTLPEKKTPIFMKFLICFSLEIFSSLEENFLKPSLTITNWIDNLFLNKKIDENFFEAEFNLFESPENFNNLFSIIKIFANLNKENKESVLDMFLDFVKLQNLRENSKNSWSKEEKKIKINKDYKGLQNLGCTCYINSSLQQMFMIKPLKNYILNLKVKKDFKLLYNFQRFLAELNFSSEKYINPKFLISQIKTFEGTKIDVLKQMDMEEFFITFFDQIDLNLKKSKKKKLSQFFEGKLHQEIITKGCNHKSVKVDNFLTVTLLVKEMGNLLTSLKNYIKWDNLEGHNKYFCNSCSEKKSARKKISFETLPNNLIFVLKRFEYDFKIGKKKKLNDKIEFPFELNMEEFFYKKDLSLKNKGYFDFYLKGVVIHQGKANGGHYYSFIKNDKDEWFCFNDEKVSRIDKEKIIDISFGGYYKNRVKSISNAYTLFYERKVVFDEEKLLVSDFDDFYFGGEILEDSFDQEDDLDTNLENECKENILIENLEGNNGENNPNQSLENISKDSNEELIREKSFDNITNDDLQNVKLQKYLESKNYKSIKSMVLKKDFKNYIYEILRSQNFYDFVEDLKIEDCKKLDYFNFLTSFLFLVLMRNCRKRQIPLIYNRIRIILKSDLEISLEFLKNLTNKNILNEFLIYCPVKDMRYLFIGLVLQALENIKKKLFVENRILNRFIRFFFNFIKELKNLGLINQEVLIIFEEITKSKYNCKILDNLGFKKFFEKFFSEKQNYFVENLLDNLSIYTKTKIQNSYKDSENENLEDRGDLKNEDISFYINAIINMDINLKKFYFLDKNLNKIQTWNYLFKIIKKRNSMKKISELFILYSEKNDSLIPKFLDSPQITIQNFKTIFFVLQELTFLKKKKINEKIHNIYTNLTNQSILQNYIFFDYFITHITQICLESKSFHSLIKTTNKNRLLKTLTNFNNYSKSLKMIKESEFVLETEQILPERVLPCFLNDPKIEDYLEKKFLRRKFFLEQLRVGDFEELVRNFRFYRFSRTFLEKVNVGGKVYVQEHLLGEVLGVVEVSMGVMFKVCFFSLRREREVGMWMFYDDESVFESI